MRAVLIDDEEGARGYLREALKAHPEIEIAGEADHPIGAIEMVNTLRPDIIFLDIQMPVLDGFQLLVYLKVNPIVIFCTAYDDYAIKAFEVHALDYLLKPVTPERLAKALERAKSEWHKLETLKQMPPRSTVPSAILCQRGGVHHAIWPHEIRFLRKEGRYTGIETQENGHFLCGLTIDFLEKRLIEPDFFRVNRAAIVHRAQVRSFETQPHGSGLVHLSDGQTESVSRARVAGFKKWFFGSQIL